jgi:outer membrane protein OmpA-like peptidoglycan-associated protein
LAQEQPRFAVNRYRPAERGSRWFTSESLDASKEHPLFFGATLDWAHRPLTVYDDNGSAIGDVVRNQSIVHIGVSYSVMPRLRLGASLPLVLATSGHSWTVGSRTYRAGSGGGIGDARLSADYRFWGEQGEFLRVGASLQAFLPIGSAGAYASDGVVRFYPRILAAGDLGLLIWAFGFGTDIRGEKANFSGRSLGSELNFTASIGVKLADGKLTFGPEVIGATRLAQNQFLEKRGTPAELLIGGHYAITENVLVGAAAGPGLSTGLGAPASRLLFSLDITPGQEKKPAAPPSDRDRDGWIDLQDACPDQPGLDSSDPAKRGCPPPKDTDKDGVADDVDACPDRFGVAKPDASKNGCPESKDRDADGVVDEADACPDEAGIQTLFAGTNGCPSPKDSDGDSVIDKNDACPSQPGPISTDAAKNGCPVATIVEDKILILERVEFDTGKATLTPESDKVLNAVLGVLKDHSEISRLSVEGHTDDHGDKQRNLVLSKQRAAAVVKWLVERGVDAKRLTSNGFGQTKPIDSNATDVGRKNNRRVEFHIETSNSNPVKAAP